MSKAVSSSPMELMHGLETPERNEMISCPLDPAHRLRKKRLQYHLLKKHPNCQSVAYMTCPFNASHRVSRQEYDLHLVECESRGSVEVSLKEQSNPHQVKKDMSVPLGPPPTLLETWDEEVIENSQDFALDPKMTSHSSKSDGNSHVVSPQSSMNSSPVRQITTNWHSIADSNSLRKVSECEKDWPYTESTTPMVSKTELEASQEIPSVHHPAGRHQSLPVGAVGQPSQRLSDTVPNHVGLRGQLNNKLQRDPASAQSPPEATQHSVAAESMVLSLDRNDAGSLASSESKDEQIKATEKKEGKFKKLLRKIVEIEEKKR